MGLIFISCIVSRDERCFLYVHVPHGYAQLLNMWVPLYFLQLVSASEIQSRLQWKCNAGC